MIIQTAGTNDLFAYDTLNFATGFTSTLNADGSVTLTPQMLVLAPSKPTSSASPGNPGQYWFDSSGLYLYQVSGASTGWRLFTGATF